MDLKTFQSPKFRSSPQNLNSKWSWNVVEVKQENQPKWLQEHRCEVQVKCLISPSSGCFHLTLASPHPCHVNRHHGWDDELTPWAWPLRGRSTSCAAPPPPGCSTTSSVPWLRGRQDQNLNVTRKIFLEALEVINSCVNLVFGVRFFPRAPAKGSS